MRGWGVTVGFDLNTKNDAYGSKKRMLVVGPTLMLDVPGFLNLSLLVLQESNAPQGVPRYTYDTHGAFEVDWSTPLPVAALPLSFEGYGLYIASKGTNEFAGPTAPETHIDMKLMADVGAVSGMGKNTLKVGVGYEYWRNKFGNPTTPPARARGPAPPPARRWCGPSTTSEVAPRCVVRTSDVRRRAHLNHRATENAEKAIPLCSLWLCGSTRGRREGGCFKQDGLPPQARAPAAAAPPPPWR
jgi:hypothetical protein